MRWTVKKTDLFKPHRWFAWFPVKLEDDEWAWLEWVEREMWDSMATYGFNYRAITKEQNDE